MKILTQRIFALLLPLALLLSVSAQAMVGAEFDDAPDTMHIMDLGAESTALLPRTQVYEAQFPDVSPDSWYYAYAAAGYEYDLFGGRDTGFAPDADITVAELLTLSARIRAAYDGDTIEPATGERPWYMPYATYLHEKDLLDISVLDTGYDTPATRAQLAGIFALSLPENCFDGINAPLVTDAFASGDYISDVDEYTPYQPQILWLYQQGLLAGMDDTGSYWPDKTTTRAETAAVVTRMVDPSLRIALTWTVIPSWSAAGTTFASLIPLPDSASVSPDYNDADAVDAAVRRMLALDEHSVSLRYTYALTRSDAATLANVFTAQVKSYCEQMYNSVLCRTFSNGAAVLTFSATACTDEELAQYRDETMAKAIEVHDALWESGQLTKNMSEYEIARVYFLWLCDHCEYDYPGANDDYSLSHIAYNALLHGKAVCDGYTGAYNLFLKMEGIDCYALHNDTHIWTVAILDGTEYHIDTTWGDQSGRTDTRYFGMTAAQSYQEHSW